MIASYEISASLKNAGFPQPDPEFGQAWYLDDDLGIVTTAAGSWMVLSSQSGKRYVSRFFDLSGLVFAPSADDILPRIPNGRLETWGDEISCRIDCDAYPERFTADSCANACALAWLALQNPADRDEF